MNYSEQNNELIGNSQGFILGGGRQKERERRDRIRKAVKRGNGRESQGRRRERGAAAK